MYFSSTNEGIYHMFVSLTTANHPDVLMPAYNREWYMMLLLFSFMLVTNLFLLNVFLGVVTSEYATMVKQFYLGKYEVCEGMLRFAYRLVRSRVTRGKTMGSIERTEMNLQDQFRMMVEKDEGIDKHGKHCVTSLHMTLFVLLRLMPLVSALPLSSAIV